MSCFNNYYIFENIKLNVSVRIHANVELLEIFANLKKYV